MTLSDHHRNDERRKEAERRLRVIERWELLGHIQALVEPIMVGLGLVFLILLFVDYAGVVAGTQEGLWLSNTLQIIWAVFLIDFLVRFAVAPGKLSFLRTNWLTVISLALPFLRPLRALRAIRAVRTLSLVRLIGGANRGLRLARRITGGHQIAYVGATTILVVVAGAVGIWFFDRGAEGSGISNFSDALWWSSTLVTTVGSEIFAVTPEGRIIGFLIRLYALSVFGLLTATIASYFVGQKVVEDADATESATPDVSAELAALRREIASLRAQLEAGRDDTATTTSGRREPLTYDD